MSGAGRIRGRSRPPIAVAVALATALGPGIGATARAQEADAPAPVIRGVARDLYLEVGLNGEGTGLIAHFRERGTHLFVSAHDLGEIGIVTGDDASRATARVSSDTIDMAGPDSATASDVADIALDALPGVRYTYDAARQTIDLNVPDALRRPYDFDTRARAATPVTTSSRGFLINYDAYAQSASAARFALWSEERYFAASGVFSNTGTAYFYRDDRRYVRYDSSWTRSDPGTLTTRQYGDTISSSLDWTRSVRIGGFQWRSNFALRPDLVTFPMPTLGGSAAVPSAVDVYVNNVRQASGNVPSGPFVVNNVPGIVGGGQATVITRDALGRTVSTSVPLYVETRMLAAGLSSYSMEVGFLRRAYGVESFDYAPHPAFSASLRRGVSDTLTLEGHGEATHGVANAGAGSLIRLGTAGVVSASLAASGGHQTGLQAGIGYQIIEPLFSVDAQTLRAYRGYGDIASSDGAPVARQTDRVSVALPLFGRQTLAFSYLGSRYARAAPSHIGSVSYTLNVGNLAAVTLSGYRDFSGTAASGLFLSVSVSLGSNTSISTNAGRQDGHSTYNVNATRPPDYDGGFGWAAQAGGTGNVTYRQAQAQYLGKDGEVTAVVQSTGRQANASLDMAGALVFMDGAALPARRIDDGFALVATGTAGIPVLHENRPIGVTNDSGHLLVPDLSAYRSNRIGIDGMKLPADARIDSTTQDIVPRSQSGVLASFRVTRYSAASVVIAGPDGALLPPGARVHHRESGGNTIVGYDGLAFIENLRPDNHLDVEAGTLHCTLAFAYTRSSDGSLPTYGPLRCR